MRILGINGGFQMPEDDDHTAEDLHDAAAVLVHDGRIVAAIEEERLSRLKHSNCFPVHAIRACLAIGDTTLDDVDCIAVNWVEPVVTSFVQISYLTDARVPDCKDGRARINGLFLQHFGTSVSDKLAFCDHHVAHAYSALLNSGFGDALVMIADGRGDYSSGLILDFFQGQGTILRRLSIDQSLGLFYQLLCSFIGYSFFEEYKVMALAALGNPDVYGQLFRQRYRLCPEGHYELDPGDEWMQGFWDAGLLEVARRRSDPLLECHAHFAAAIQDTLETIVLHILRHFRAVTGRRVCCLAGGVAHNCAMNGKIASAGLFDDLHVAPASNDAGGALGAAVWAGRERIKGADAVTAPSVYAGSDIGSDLAIESKLTEWAGFLRFRRAQHLPQDVAELIERGSIVGWAQGRSEFGPRALGNRSILADPRVADNRERINLAVKKREAYRPFAPAVLDEWAERIFDMRYHADRYRHMGIAARVRPEYANLLPAVTHMDGTARLQTVSRTGNYRFWDLIRIFGERTGIPVLLNTSFNNDSEPIVDSVQDAIVCFLTTDLDCLVIGDYIICKQSTVLEGDNFLALKPRIVPHAKLLKRVHASGPEVTMSYEIQRTKNSDASRPLCISEETFRILADCSGAESLGDLLERNGIRDGCAARLSSEINELWSKRLVQCCL